MVEARGGDMTKPHEHTELKREKIAPTARLMKYLGSHLLAPVTVIWYNDGCVRVRVANGPYVVPELYITGVNKPAVLTLRPRG